MNRFRYVPGLLVLAWTALTCAPAQAFFHFWRFTEFFSNADGSVQFIELKSSGAFETAATGAEIRSASTGKVFTFPSSLSGSTQNKHLLIATAGFASLPGAVTPNFTLPSTSFFNPAGDTISLFAGFPIDSRTFSSVPTDGVMSRNYPADALATNTPANFSGASGSLNLPPPSRPSDFNGDGHVDGADLDQWRGDFGLNNDSDADNDGDSDGADFLVWQQQLGMPAAATDAVPEPASLGLLGFSILIALHDITRRRTPILQRSGSKWP
jgi:serralysin